MSRIISVALLCVAIGMTAYAASQDKAKVVVKINDSVYMAPTTGNVYLVTTPAGNVLIDTASSDQAPEARKLLRCGKPWAGEVHHSDAWPCRPYWRNTTLERSWNADHRPKELR